MLQNRRMTLPLEVNFWNMPREPGLEAAAEDEVRSLEPGGPLTSCRVSVMRSERSQHPHYDVQIVVLAGSRVLCAGCDPTWSRLFRHEPDTAAAALHRAFVKIHAQLN